MILMLHIVIALASVAFGGVMLLSKQSKLMQAHVGLFGATIITGTAVAIQSPQALAHLCVTGVVFSLASIGLQMYARRRVYS